MNLPSKNSVYQYGNTIRLECSFFDFDNLSVDPKLIKIIIYNNKYEVLLESILGLNNRIGVGEYFYDYTTANESQKFYYEWYGEIDGTPSIKRGQFATVFI